MIYMERLKRLKEVVPAKKGHLKQLLGPIGHKHILGDQPEMLGEAQPLLGPERRRKARA